MESSFNCICSACVISIKHKTCVTNVSAAPGYGWSPPLTAYADDTSRAYAVKGGLHPYPGAAETLVTHVLCFIEMTQAEHMQLKEDSTHILVQLRH